MQTAGQYRLQQALSTCEVGDVWSGVGAGGESVTVAVLNELASADDRWRGAFAAAADALANATADRLPIVGTDYQGPRPWVACAPERGGGAAQIFEVLGQRLVPVVVAPPEPEPEPAPAPEPAPSTTDPEPDNDRTLPLTAPPPRTQDIDPPTTPLRFPPSKPAAKPRRAGLLVALAAVAGLLVGAGGTAAGMSLSDDGTPAPIASTTPAPTDEQLLLATPTAPGIEPPVGGGWPPSWPTFGSTESTKPMKGLEGVGFDFRVPPTWNCDQVAKAAAAVHYRCGQPSTGGGDLTVRTCETPCTEERRTALRQREEAWGLQWTRSGPFATWAETSEIDGKPMYGLVYVAFWRSTPEGQIDRQLVLRLTAPPAAGDQLKKVVNSIREQTFTL